MEIIETSIQINAEPQIVFDLSRSIELHVISTAATQEKAIAGVTTGLINKGETVTWQARHLGRTRYFETIITHMEAPVYFRDAMLRGDFKRFEHEHFFEKNAAGTLMKDKLVMEAPYGLIGKWFNRLFLKRYIGQFIRERNQAIKHFAESGEWKKILN